jgi:hypothetical protein
VFFDKSAKPRAAGHAQPDDDILCCTARVSLRQIDPALRVSNLKDFTSLSRSEDMAKYVEGMQDCPSDRMKPRA